jgi:hypothetical protein
VGSSLGWGWVVLFGPPVELNKWVFLVATYDGANMRFYVNKTLYGPKSATYIPNDTYPTRIGAGATEGSGSYYFNGLIDEVRIYNRALSQDEISRICDYNEFIRDGLVLYLDFTEGEGNIAYDKSGLGNHGTIYGAEWVVKKAKRVLSI